MMSSKALVAAALLALVAGIVPPSAAADETSDLATFEEIAEEAYVYAYPLMLMEITRQVGTNVVTTDPAAMRGPMNTWMHARRFPDATFTDVVRPNADTLYSILWLDVSQEPWIVTVPDAGDRYYLLPFLDMWTNVFAVPGTRTTGDGPQTLALVGPGWRGRLPAGVTRIDCPTPTVWCIGRTNTKGAADYENVHRFQDGLGAAPLTCWCRGRTSAPRGHVDPSVDMKTPPADQVQAMDAGTFFRRTMALMAVHAPKMVDQPILARMQRIGLVPGRPFDASSLDEAHRAALDRGVARGRARIPQAAARMATPHDGWQVMREFMGTYGANYERRAAVALFGLGANVPEDAVYPSTTTDVQGKPYDGHRRYVLHFAADQLPPVNGFWSLTAYTERGTFVANPIDRYAIGDRDALHRNADGSLDLYLQHDDPGGEKTANWLPVPDAAFNLALRLYWPKEPVLTGVWNPPGVTAVD